ncbi:hypothetical protein [Cupriavidus sp. CuC1]|uniref:hypothetical protein n=1 Tax=Cupriavidus sp. CuC1 TaxID=3373131 RepID=UPI0037CD2D3E
MNIPQINSGARSDASGSGSHSTRLASDVVQGPREKRPGATLVVLARWTLRHLEQRDVDARLLDLRPAALRHDHRRTAVQPPKADMKTKLLISAEALKQ